MSGRGSPERGSILIHTALALVSFTTVSALVVDLGLQLVARHQIQTSADAAALAAATALSFESYTDRTDSGPAKRTALAVATTNTVWGQAPAVAAADVTFPVCADSFEAGPSAPPKLACVNVAVYRDGAHSNPLATMFAQLAGVNTAGVAAAATAESKEGNATDCLKPLAVPDRWIERYPASGSWTPTSTFDKWNPSSPSTLLSPPDSYAAPTALSSGSGLTMTNAFGTQVVVTPGSTAQPVSPISPWKYLPVQIPGSLYGTDIRQNIEQCAGAMVAIGDRLTIGPGGVSGVVATALQTLVTRDPGARWDAATQRIVASCADAIPRCASMSPRLIALAVYDPGDLADASRAGATSLLVRNIVGFFIDSVSGTNATGHITRHPGRNQTTAIRLIDGSSFLRASLLVE